MIIKKINFSINEDFLNKEIFNNLNHKNLNFSILQNNEEKIAKFVLLIGKNGSGKTSLLTTIAKLFDVHEERYRKYLKNPHSGHWNVKNFNLNSLGYAKITIGLWNESIYFFFNDIIENSKFFDWEINLQYCYCLHEKNLWKKLPRYTWLTPNNYANDAKFTKYWEKLCFKEYKKTLNRNKYELEKKCYKTMIQVNKNDTMDNLNVLSRYNDFFKKKRLKWVFWENRDPKAFCDFVFNNNRNKIYQLSSGLRHQIILRSIMSGHFEHIFLLDEPENSLYPFEQEEIIDFIIENSRNCRRKHQFFIATHSPFILKKFLNNDDAVIIDIDDGKNIKDNLCKKLLLGENKPSYDEINYLYYGIVTPNYYLSLFEKLRTLICKKCGDKDMKISDIDNWLKNEASNKENICKIKCEKGEQTILVRLRHLLAHGIKGEDEYKYYQEQKKQKSVAFSEIFNKETKEFYENINNIDKNIDKFETLLKENIELIRTTIMGLINLK